jgi:GNAT superfamily N-acetyltransferase
MDECCIIPLKREHIGPIVDIHMRAFQGFFLTFLGAKFLKEFYRSFIKEETGISLVAVDKQKGDLLGAVVGAASPFGFFRKLAVRRWWAFGLASLRAIAKNPSIIRRLFRALTYRGGPTCHPGYALLSSIVVTPEIQKKGVGKALLNAWVEEAKKRSCPGAFLTTDSLDNEAVNHFYQRSGWILEGTFITPEGRGMNRYIMIFNDRKT